ncbi:hypothetical protein C8Q78DRAFT_1026627 [Trametes maxima]|nr:hypothetical protein C8Q78DRAFT_1026627 [Trametes maxima]
MSLPKRPHPYASTRPEDVFDGKSEEELRRDIYLLTYILSGCKTGVAKSTKHKSRPTVREHLEWLQRIAKILTVGCGAADATAIAGHLEGDRVVLVVCNRDRGHEGAEGSAQSPVLNKVISQSEETAATLLMNCDEEERVPTHIDFATHLRDVTTILQYVIRQPSNARPLHLARLDRLVFRRTYTQLRAQVAIARNVWGKFPTTFIRRMFSSGRRPIAPAQRITLPDPIPVPVSESLKRHNLEPSRRGGYEFVVSSDNVSSWASLLDELVAPLRGMMEQEADESLDISSNLTLPSKDHLDEVSVALHRLDFILESSLIEAICFFLRRETEYEDCQRVRQERWGTMLKNTPESAQEHKRASSTSAPNTRLDSHAVFPQETYEQTAGHVRRYFKTLAGFATSVSALSDFQIPSYCRVVDVYHLRTPPIVSVDPGYVRRFMDTYLRRLARSCEASRRPNAARFVENARVLLTTALLDGKGEVDLCAIREHASVHPEAALMALAHSAHLNYDAEPCRLARSESVFLSEPETELLIGTNRPCCTCCAHLATSLAALESGATYTLPGTHSTVSPWISPPLNVPVSSLEDLRRELLAMLHVVACKHDSGLLSTRYRSITDEPAEPVYVEEETSIDWATWEATCVFFSCLLCQWS